jgi:SAM-dependent methyltransferase
MTTLFNSESLADNSESSSGTQAPNFDCLAKLYRWMELATFGPLLTDCRTAFLPDMTSARRALVLGDGDGRFTAALLQENRQVCVTAVDASEAMLNALLCHAGTNASRVSLHRADARHWNPENGQYDLVATHFFLDCLTTEECRALTVKLREAVSPATLWVVSEFAVPDDWFGNLVARPLVWLLYRAFRVLTGLRVRNLPDYHAALRDAGFTLMQRRCRLRGMLVSEMWRPKA